MADADEDGPVDGIAEGGRGVGDFGCTQTKGEKRGDERVEDAVAEDGEEEVDVEGGMPGSAWSSRSRHLRGSHVGEVVFFELEELRLQSASCEQERQGRNCPRSYLCRGMIFKGIDCFSCIGRADDGGDAKK